MRIVKSYIKKYYFFIGLIIACVGVLLTPLIPKLISGDIPGQLNVYILYLLNLAATVMTYWLFAYKNSLLLSLSTKRYSEQDNDCNNIAPICDTINCPMVVS